MSYIQYLNLLPQLQTVYQHLLVPVVLVGQMHGQIILQIHNQVQQRLDHMYALLVILVIMFHQQMANVLLVQPILSIAMVQQITNINQLQHLNMLIIQHYI
jgi:hypothetical protein